MTATETPIFKPSCRMADILDAAELMALAHDPHGNCDLPIRWSLEKDCWQVQNGVVWERIDQATLESVALTAVRQAGVEVTEETLDGCLRCARAEMAA